MTTADRGPVRRRGPFLACLLVLAAAPARAQSLTAGAVEGEVVLPDGTPVPQVSLTLTEAASGASLGFRSDLRGRFGLQPVAPGSYILLAERAGYQPVRYRGVRVVGGERTVLRVEITRRPPPITQVDEREAADQRLVPATPRAGQVLVGRELEWPNPTFDLAELGRNSVLATPPRDGRPGFTLASAGLPQGGSRLLVDGLPATWMRHPGVGPDPAGAPVFPTSLLEQVQLLSQVADVEGPSAGGLVLNAFGRRGTERFRFEPFVAVSGKPGIPAVQNPADSSATSLWAGATLGGALIPDKARFLAGFHYQDLETPAARPWERDSGLLGGAPVPLAATLEQVAADSFGASGLARFTRPPVRRWRGGAGGVRVDWQLSPAVALLTRANLARWNERSTLVGEDPGNGAETDLEGREFSGGAVLASSWRNGTSNELRLGYRRARRDWSGPNLPATLIVGDGIAVGRSPLAPARFERNAWDVVESFSYQFGRARQHLFKIGASWSRTSWSQDYLYGRGGIFAFGDLERFAAGSGTFWEASEPSGEAAFRYTELGLFGQLVWQPRPGLRLLGGLRFDRQDLPTTAIRTDTAFAVTFGFANSRVPRDRNNIGPRAGLLWEGGADRSWVVGLGAALVYGNLDPAVFSEVLLSDGRQTVRRGVGSFAAWPAADSAAAPGAGARFALFDPAGNYRDPKTAKVDLEVRKTLPSSLTLAVNAAYHHTDYLLRRSDLNLPASPAGTAPGGRPVFGTLVQQGGLLVAAPGSNRRLPGFDLVSALASTGFADYYEAGLSLERRRARGLSFGAGYTFSRARDNWLRSRTGDPADELSPFPADRPGKEWAEGRSDFDVPHRIQGWAEVRLGARVPITVGARYRYRSGLPYTPGFRPGVDANADGSGNNDPAFVDPSVPGVPALVARHGCLKEQVGELAERNSCRSDGVHALDLNLVIGLPVRSLGGRVEFTLEAFNVVGTPSGVVDRALVLVDPQGTVSDDGQGNLTLPLIGNPNFGKLLSRRNEPRLLRVGLRLGY
ncbi:MAG TPA: carboxypeptidase regulatory-like domain-containing protein [Gemmatimonadales bacterium]|nr:carboxypeptidase regulatory-like domain-containing protein [Gemmatimonadales bacterium]